MDLVSMDAAFGKIDELWSPRVAAKFNGQSVKLARAKGEFVWHHHDDGDEVFLVWKGSLRMELRDRVVELGAGDLFVVPRGVEHRPVALEEAWVVLFEPTGMVNTGNAEKSELTTAAKPL